MWLVVFIAVFTGDFIGYWRHRLEHTPFLWPAHAIHHSDTAMTWTTRLPLPSAQPPHHRADRHHARWRCSACRPGRSMVNTLMRHYYGLFIHMDLPWTYGPLGRVFVSPAMHRWHHIRDADGAGVNFATVFSRVRPSLPHLPRAGPVHRPARRARRHRQRRAGAAHLAVRCCVALPPRPGRHAARTRNLDALERRTLGSLSGSRSRVMECGA